MIIKRKLFSNRPTREAKKRDLMLSVAKTQEEIDAANFKYPAIPGGAENDEVSRLEKYKDRINISRIQQQLIFDARRLKAEKQGVKRLDTKERHDRSVATTRFLISKEARNRNIN